MLGEQTIHELVSIPAKAGRGFGSGNGTGFGSHAEASMPTPGASHRTATNGSLSSTGPTRRNRPMSAERVRPGAGSSDMGLVASQRPAWQKTPTVTTGADGRERISVRPTSAPPERPANRRNLSTTLPYSEHFLEPTGESVDIAIARFQVMSLPEQGKVRAQLKGILDQETKRNRCRRADRLLVMARSKYGDWRSSRARDLACLIQALAEGGRHAEMTRVLSDPQFLQRRLRLGTLPELIADFDLCEKALEDLIVSEPIHKRSADGSAALSRRMYISSLRHYLRKHAKGMDGHDSLGFFVMMLTSQFSSIIHPLVTSLLNFVNVSEAFFSARERRSNRPVELWLPLHERASLSLLQSDPSYVDSLAKELLIAVSVPPGRLAVRFEAADAAEVDAVPGWAVVSVSTLVEGVGASSVSVAEHLRSYLMLPWSDLCGGMWGKLLELGSVREGCEVHEGNTAMEDVRWAAEVRERLQHAQDSGLVECLDEAKAARIRRLWGHTEEVLGVNGDAAHGAAGEDAFGYEMVVNALRGYATPGKSLFEELGSSIADAAGVRYRDVSVQVLPDRAVRRRRGVRLLVCLPFNELHRPLKIHKAWQSRFQVSQGPTPVQRTLWWWFCRPIAHDLRDADLMSLINDSIAIKGHGAASVRIHLSQLRRWVRVELPTEIPVVEEGAVWMEALKDRLYKEQGRILSGQADINDMVVASQASGLDRDDWEVSPDSMEWLVAESAEQERFLDLHLREFARKDSRERLLIQLQALCHYHHYRHGPRGDHFERAPSASAFGARLVVLEGSAGSGRSATLCRLAKDLALLSRTGVAVGVRRPGQALESLMEYVAMDLGMQMCGRGFAHGGGEAPWMVLGQAAPAVVVLDGLSTEELRLVLPALLQKGEDGAPEAEQKGGRGPRSWERKVRRAVSKVRGGLTCVVSTERAEAACAAAASVLPASSVAVLQVEPMSLAEQRILLRSHAQGATGSIGGGASLALKALEEVVAVHARLGALPGAKAVGELSPLSPLFLICATRYAMGSGSESSRAVDEGFPRSVVELAARLLEQQERRHGKEAVVAAVEPMLWEGEGMEAEEVSAASERQRSSVESVLRGLWCLLCPPYLGSGRLSEAMQPRYAPVNGAVRKLLKQYLRQATRAESEGTVGALAALGLRSLDAVEDFLPRAERSGFSAAGSAVLPVPGKISVERVQCRGVLVSWTVQEPVKAPGAPRDPAWWQELEVRRLHSKEEREACLGVLKVERTAGRRLAGGDFVRFESWFTEHLLPAHPYLLQIRACRVGEEGPWRSTTLHTPHEPPKPQIQLSDVRATSVKVQWSLASTDQANMPETFVLEVWRAGSSKWKVVYEGPEWSYSLKDLEPAERVQVRVCSRTNGDSSAWDKMPLVTAVPRTGLVVGAARYLIGILRTFDRKKSGVSELRDVTDRSLNYFEKEGDPHGAGTWVGATKRSLEVLLRKMINSSRWSGLQGLVCNPMFMTKSIEELGVGFMIHNVLEQAVLRIRQEGQEGAHIPQARTIGAILELLKQQRKPLEAGDKYATVLAENIEDVRMYRSDSMRNLTVKQTKNDPAELVVGAGRAIVDKLLHEAMDAVQQTKSRGRSEDDDGELLIKAARLLEDLTAVQRAGLSRLCESRDELVHGESLDARVEALEAWVAGEGAKGLEMVKEKLLASVDVRSENLMENARNLSTLMDMQSLKKAAPGSKALIRMELSLPFDFDRSRGADSEGDEGFRESVALMRSKLLSALTNYAKRKTQEPGICMRLVRLDPTNSGEPGGGSTCLGVVLVSVVREERIDDGLDMTIAEVVAKGVAEKEETLMSELDGLVQSAEFCTDTRARFLVIGLACSVRSASVPKDKFRRDVVADVAKAVEIPESMVRVMKITPRRTFAVLEVDTGLHSRRDLERRLSDASVVEIERKVAEMDGSWLQDRLETRDIVSVTVVDSSVPPLLPGERTAIKLFNSSTFSDMHAERDFLNNFVFPAIRCSCVKRRIDFSWIDFRWGGVTSTESQKGLGVVKCLKKIDECVLRLPHGITIPVVIGMLGKRAGWIPEVGSKDREQAEKLFKWVGANKEKYKGYSVTGLEMEHAFFRLPFASESFFFIRDHAFMGKSAAEVLRHVPESARSVFSESKPEAQQFAEFLREQAARIAEGRCFQYKPVWQDPPYHFATSITMHQVDALKAELQRQHEQHKAMRTDTMIETMRWWLLLKEQYDLATANQGGGDVDGKHGEEESADADLQLHDAVHDPFIAELQKTVKDLPTHGNQNVAAHGVRFKFSRLGLGVMRMLQGMFEAYYPAMAPIKFKHWHLEDRNAQEAVVEEFASSFCDGTRERALEEMDVAMFGEGAEAAAATTVLALEGGANSGRTATLARFVFTKSYKTYTDTPQSPKKAATPLPTTSARRRRSSVEAVKGWIFAYFFCPFDCPTERVLAYLATEIAVQHRGSAALAAADEAAGESAKARFEKALGEALREHKVLLVVDGLGSKELAGLVRGALKVYEEARKGNGQVLLRCLVSCDERVFEHREVRHVSLGELEEEERREMCKFWMARFGKENLTDGQLDIAVKKSEGKGCLYLVLFCAEASLLSLYERVDYELEHMQVSVEDIWVHRTLPRLEGSYGRELVKQMMLALLAYPRGLRLSELKFMMLGHPSFQQNSGPGTSVLVEQVADALLLYMRPGHSGEADSLLCFNSKTIIASTKRRYAPVAAKHDEEMLKTRQRKQALGIWGTHRGAVIECVPDKIEKAPQPQEEPPELDTREFAWSFDVQGQRELIPDKENVQVRCTKDATTSALVSPSLPKDKSSYFEVVIENGGSLQECKVRVGVIVWTDQSKKQVPKSSCASSHKMGWMFDCNNGNMMNKSVGNAFVQVQCAKGDRVGLSVTPATGDVIVYVNTKFVGKLPIPIKDRSLFKKEDLRFVVDLRKDSQVLIARQDKGFVPETPPEAKSTPDA